MNTAINLEALKPSDIVGVRMHPNRVFHIWINHPILDADVDYEVAVHIGDELRKLEEVHGKATGMFIDVTNYNRLDCVEIFGMTVPDTKTRKVHEEACKNGIFKRIAFCKKDASHFMKFCVRMVSLSGRNKETRVFTDEEKALKWLEEGAQSLLQSESDAKRMEDLKTLRPEEIVGIKMDSNRMLHLWFNQPIIDADKDYETALYAAEQQKKLEEANGKSLGLFIDISNYERLDCEDLYDISLPSTKVRELHFKMFKDSALKRIAIYKEEASRIVHACAKMVLLNQDKEVKVFGDREKALNWLGENIKT